MAIAGRVMPMPKGEFDLTVIYDTLDIVTHNNKLWISRVSNNVGNTPVESNTVYWMLIMDSSGDGIPIVAAISSDGVSYVATVNNYDAFTIGKPIIVIPNTTSTSVNPTLNVNGLGDKYIRVRTGYTSAATTNGALAGWISENRPFMVYYDGTYWISDSQRINAAALQGIVTLECGGTGANNAADARANLDVYSKAEVEQLIADAISALGQS